MNKKIIKIVSFVVMLLMLLPTITAMAQPPIPLPDTVVATGAEHQPGRAFGRNIDRSVQRSLAHDVYADYFMIGSIIANEALFTTNTSLWDLIRWHFNALTHENHMKPHEIWNNPANPPHQLARAQRQMEHANNAGFYTIGHTFVWHNQSNNWPFRTLTPGDGQNRNIYGFEDTLQFNNTRAEAEAQLHQFISTMGQEFHYPNPWAVNEWDVINEMFRDNPEHPEDWRRALRTGTLPVMRPSFWYGAYAVEGGRGWDYVWDAFILSARYAPDAKRVYNDFNDEELDGKAIAKAEMVRELNARFDAEFPYPTVRSCPRPLIEEVGIQAHYNMRLRFDNLESVLQIYGELGIDISLTELDVSLTETTPINFNAIGGINSDLYYEQAIFYARLFNILKEYRADGFPITRVTWWGTSDQQNWRGGFHPMIWRRVASLADLSPTGNAVVGIHVPKESFWAVMDPECWLNLNDFTGSRPKLDSFEFAGEVFDVRHTRTRYDVHVPNDVTQIEFTKANLNFGELAEYMIVDFILYPADGVIRDGQPVTATVTMAWPGIEVHPRTHVIYFGHMSADWLIDQNYSDTGYRSLLDVRFSDGVTALTLAQEFYCETTGELLYLNTESFPTVPRHGRERHVIATDWLICGEVYQCGHAYPTPLALCEDCQADQVLVRTVRKENGQLFVPARFTDFVTPEYGWMFADTIRDDTNYIFVNVATGMALAHEGRAAVLPGGGIEQQVRGYWSSDPITITNGMITYPTEIQDNIRFYIREAFHPNVGPYTREAGFVPHTIQSLVHGGLIEPFVIWRAASTAPTVNMYSNNHIADRNLDRGAWLNTPIVNGQTTMFLFSGPETANPGIYALFGNDIGNYITAGTGANQRTRFIPRGGFAAQRIEDPFNVPDNARFWVMEYRSNYTFLGALGFNIFNNGPGGAPSTPNESLAQAGLIRMWPQLDGVGGPVRLREADTIVALDQNGDCVIDFVRVNRVGDGTYFASIDVDKNQPWQYIDFSITAMFGQTVELRLVNALFEPPPVLTYTLFAEDWRPSINIRFFLNGTPADIPLANMELVVDGVVIDNIRDYTLNIAGWQTSQTTVFICKVRHNWEHLTFTVTYQGQTLFFEFINNMFVPPAPDPVLTTTIFAEDWRTTINIRFFLDGVLTALPLGNIQLIADGVPVANIRDFTINVAGWQTETNAIFINKLAPPWQTMVVNITAYGQTLTYTFINNMS